MNRLASPALGLALAALSSFSLATLALAQAPAAPKAAAAPKYVPEDHRPPLAFREDFIDEPNETPVTLASIKNKALKFGLYGPGAAMVAKSHHASPKDESGYIWTGSCTQVCGFTLYDPAAVDHQRSGARLPVGGRRRSGP